MKPEMDTLFEKANNYFFSNDYESAYKLLKEIVEKDPRHFQSYEKLAQIEIVRKRIHEAVDYYKKYLRYNKNNSDVLNELGNLYFEIKDYKNSMKCYKKAIRYDYDAYWSYYNIGLTELEMGHKSDKSIENAIKWFKKAIHINKEYYPALNEIGLYYLSKMDYRKAKEYFFRSLRYNANYKYPYFNLSKLYKENNQREKSKLYLVKALRVDAKYTSALNNLGILYYEEGDYQSALYYYSKAIKSDRDYKFAYYNMALVFIAQAMFQKAYIAIKKALDLDPDYVLALREKKNLEQNYHTIIDKDKTFEAEDLDPDKYKSVVTNPQELFSEEQKDNDADKYFSERFGRNVTKMARNKELFDIIGRESVIDDVLEVLFSLKKNNPLLIGKAGVGKTSIVEGLAQRIVSGKVPEFFKNKEVVEINMGVLVAGTTFRGDFEKRLKSIVEEAKKNPDLILFIDEIHTILGAGETSGSNLDAANIMKPALAKGELRCIGATTLKEYQNYFQKDSALDRRFTKVRVDELDKSSTLDILHNLKKRMSEHYNVSIDESLLTYIVDISHEEIKNRVFPDKAIDILEKSFSRAALKGEKEVTHQLIKSIVGEYIGLKHFGNDIEQNKYLNEMENYIKQRLIGQDKALSVISNRISLAKRRYNFNPNRPDGVLLFTGPSGVGKTYMAKLIAEFLYGTSDNLISINMSEYSESHSVSRLIGSPPGYVGHDNGSYLASKMLEVTSGVILLDEIDKAHREVQKIFLQIFDDGKLTDTSGKDLYFSNYTIILTSNVIVNNSLGFGYNKEDSNSKLNEYFSHEFINRIDEVISFDSVSFEDAEKIVEYVLIKESKETFIKKDLKLDFDKSFIDFVVSKGYDKKKGVRNLRNVFEKTVINGISQAVKDDKPLEKLQFTVENNNVIVK